MKCHRQPQFLQGSPIQITNILEVRLDAMVWRSIKTFAAMRSRTYSTMTRYCVLRLARKTALSWTPKLTTAYSTVCCRTRGSGRLHRHVVCLYGEDEKLIRLAAIDLGITMSAFIRLALELYLPIIVMEKHSRWKVTDAHLTMEGIRFLQEIQIFAENGGPWPHLRSLSCIPFEIDSYW